MNIYLISSWYPTPKTPLYVPFIAGQAQALARAGHKVTVINCEIISLKDWEKPGLSRRYEKGVDVFQYILPIYRFGSDEFTRKLTEKYIKKVYKLAQNENGKPDIIHIHASCFAGIEGVKIAKENGIKCVLTEHFSKLVFGEVTKAEFKCLDYAIKNADRVVAVSGFLAKTISEKFGRRAEVIPNFVDTTTFSPDTGSRKRSEFQFITCGFLSYRKGMDILLKAFAKMQENQDGSQLLIVGDGAERENLEYLSKSLGISHSVTFAGGKNHEQLAELMRESDCFVLPSRGETFGVVYIEALASGIPIIATKCGGPEDIVHDKNGILTEIDDVDALAHAMQEIKDNYARYDRNNMRQEAEEKYSEKKIISQITDLYNHLKE